MPPYNHHEMLRSEYRLARRRLREVTADAQTSWTPNPEKDRAYWQSRADTARAALEKLGVAITED